jgi:hypothetical protein
LLEVVGVHDYCERVLGVDARRGANETLQGVLGFFEAAFADEMPWGLRGEEKDGKEEYRPCPLDC